MLSFVILLFEMSNVITVKSIKKKKLLISLTFKVILTYDFFNNYI